MDKETPPADGKRWLLRIALRKASAYIAPWIAGMVVTAIAAMELGIVDATQADGMINISIHLDFKAIGSACAKAATSGLTSGALWNRIKIEIFKRRTP